MSGDHQLPPSNRHANPLGGITSEANISTGDDDNKTTVKLAATSGGAILVIGLIMIVGCSFTTNFESLSGITSFLLISAFVLGMGLGLTVGSFLLSSYASQVTQKDIQLSELRQEVRGMNEKIQTILNDQLAHERGRNKK